MAALIYSRRCRDRLRCSPGHEDRFGHYDDSTPDPVTGDDRRGTVTTSAAAIHSHDSLVAVANSDGSVTFHDAGEGTDVDGVAGRIDDDDCPALSRIDISDIDDGGGGGKDGIRAAAVVLSWRPAPSSRDGESSLSSPPSGWNGSADLVVGTTDGHVSFWSVVRSDPSEARGDDCVGNFFGNSLRSRGGNGTASEPFGGGSCVSCIRTFASDAVHRSRITNALWDLRGATLVTSDSAGTVCVWRRGMGNGDAAAAAAATGYGCQSTNIVPVVRYQKSSSGVTSIVFVRDALRGPDDAETIDAERDAGSHVKPRCNEDATFFFFGTEGGSVFLADDRGFCTEVYTLSPPSSIDHLYYHAERGRLIAISRSLALVQLRLHDNDRRAGASFVRKTKLGNSGGDGSECKWDTEWIGGGIVVSAAEEEALRFWDLSRDEAYFLPLPRSGFGRRCGSGERDASSIDAATSVAYDPVSRRLAAGTRGGRIAIWTRSRHLRLREEEDPPDRSSEWTALPSSDSVNLDGPVRSLAWGGGGSCRGKLGAGDPTPALLVARTDDGVHLVREEELVCSYRHGVAAVQTTRSVVSVERCDAQSDSVLLDARVKIEGLAVSDDHIVAWSLGEILVYRLYERSCEILSDIPIAARAVALHEDTLFVARGENLLLTDLTGAQRLSVHFSAEEEGRPVLLDAAMNNLAIATDRGTIKIMNLQGKEPYFLGKLGRFEDARTGRSLGSIQSIRCNADGSKVSIISKKKASKPPCLYIYDAERDVVEHIDLGGIPVSHFWDEVEAKLLSVEVEVPTANECALDEEAEPATTSPETESVLQILTIFITESGGIHAQDVIPMDGTSLHLAGISAPRLYFIAGRESVNGGTDAGSVGPVLESKVMRDFRGLEDESPATISTLIDFSYFLTIGDMDEAYQCARLVKAPSVWESMANVCVKKRNLDMASLCLANMGNARGCAVVRAAKREPEEQVPLAAVAVQLGLMEDAVTLYTECERFDLLNKLYQARGSWEDAFAVANSKDRIHLKQTHYLYAKYLERRGNHSLAKEHLEKAGMPPSRVLKLLLDSDLVRDLEGYIVQHKDPELFKWYAAHLESIGNLDLARQYYTTIGDHLSLTWLCIHDGDLDAARACVEGSGCEAAAYHLARHMEGIGRYSEAVSLYGMTKTQNHAVRLSKEHGLHSELLKAAHRCRTPQVIECARYFEERGEVQMAAQLYMKAECDEQALAMCLQLSPEERKQRPETLNLMVSLVEKLGINAPPNAVDLCTMELIASRRFETAIDLLAQTGSSLEEVIRFCSHRDVQITHDLAEKLLSRGESESLSGTGKRSVDGLMLVAKACEAQGSFLLASKKFTQAGDCSSAMKCLIKAGDTKAIVSYAACSLPKIHHDVYVMAANYLQTLDWRDEPMFKRKIIQFYTRAKSFEHLTLFFDSCAQYAADENKDFDQALADLKMAKQYCEKTEGNHHADLDGYLKRRLYAVGRFIKAKESLESDPSLMEMLCFDLLQSSKADEIVCVGDCFAVLVAHHVSNEQYDVAHKQIKKMEEQRIKPESYIAAGTLKVVNDAMGERFHDSTETSSTCSDEINEDEMMP